MWDYRHNDKKGFFSAGKDYIALTKSFNKKDARFAALALLISVIFANLIAIIPLTIYARGDEPANPFWFSFWFNIVGAAVISTLVFILSRVTGHGASSLGLNKKGTIKSILLAVVIGSIGLLLVLFRLGGISNVKLPYTAALIMPRILWLLVASFGEELLFRAYIGPRLYGVFKSAFVSIVVTGLSFGLMHFAAIIPIMIVGAGVELSFMLVAMPIYLVWHIIYHFVYAKYNNIWGPTLLHAFGNFLLLL